MENDIVEKNMTLIDAILNPKESAHNIYEVTRVSYCEVMLLAYVYIKKDGRLTHKTELQNYLRKFGWGILAIDEKDDLMIITIDLEEGEE